MDTFYLTMYQTGLYLTNPSNTNNLVLERKKEKEFLPTQTWYWSGNMLKCGTGKVLDIDGNYKAGPGAPVLAWEPHGGINQQFCSFEAEVCGFFIGKVLEKDEQNEANSERRLFVSVTEKGEASMATLLWPHIPDSINPEMQFTWRKVSTRQDINLPYKWVAMDSNELPENAFAARKDNSETFNIFPARGEIDGDILFGKVHNGTRYIGKDEEREVTSEKFSVLCIDPDAEVEWVEDQEGKFNSM